MCAVVVYYPRLGLDVDGGVHVSIPAWQVSSTKSKVTHSVCGPKLGWTNVVKNMRSSFVDSLLSAGMSWCVVAVTSVGDVCTVRCMVASLKSLFANSWTARWLSFPRLILVLNHNG